MKLLRKLVFGFSLCLMTSGCSSIYNNEYYIPVNNQTGDAKALSKNDIIRVVITHNYLDIPPNNQAGEIGYIFLMLEIKQQIVYKS